MVFCIVLFRSFPRHAVPLHVVAVVPSSVSVWPSPSLPELIPTAEPGEPVAQHRSRRWASNGTHGRAKNCGTRNIIARDRLCSLCPDQPSIIPYSRPFLSFANSTESSTLCPRKSSIFTFLRRPRYRNYNESFIISDIIRNLISIVSYILA